MDKEEKNRNDRDVDQETEPVELVLFQVPECYVYMISPRKSAASYRADEWNVNEWAWEGTLKVVSKGEECIIKLEDKTTGELYAHAILRKGEPHPVEPVIDSSRYFVLRIEENIGGRLRHAFIGIGFRERPEAYDFQAALHDHMKYLDKKKTAEEMEEQYKKSSSVDYSLKEGETLVLQLKNKNNLGAKSKVMEKGMNNISLIERSNEQDPKPCIKPPPPPPPPPSPTTTTPPDWKPSFRVEVTSEDEVLPDPKMGASTEITPPEKQGAENVPDDAFGDFQAAR